MWLSGGRRQVSIWWRVGVLCGVLLSLAFARVSAASSTASDTLITVPYFCDTAVIIGQSYPYCMVGTNPRTDPRPVNLDVLLVPVYARFADGTVLDGRTVISHVLTSPIFRPSTFQVGLTQYGDAMLRAAFWPWAGHTSYHLWLRPHVAPPLVLAVPNTAGGYQPVPISLTPRLDAPLGVVATDFLSSQIDAYLQARPTGDAHALVLFVGRDLIVRSTDEKDFAGFHSTSLTQRDSMPALWVWAYAAWFSHGPQLDAQLNQIPGVHYYTWYSDVASLSHEVVESLFNPFNINTVPPWGMTKGYTCPQSDLEVADPVAAVVMLVDGYHLSDVVFPAWFWRQVPSPAFAGRYTYLGTMSQPAPLCPATTPLPPRQLKVAS